MEELICFGFRLTAMRICPLLCFPLAACVALQCGLCSRLSAQLFEGKNEQYPIGRAPEGLKANLQIGDGTRTIFHPGELIPVTIRISSTEHTKIWVSAEPCRSEETYPTVVPPAQLQDRSGQERAVLNGFGGCMGHGWGGDIDLAKDPFAIRLLLNDNYLLDMPGPLPLLWKGDAFGSRALKSNTVAVTLLPHDTAWEAAELAHIDAQLDGPADKVGDACIRLRYLDTPAAEIDMAHRLGIGYCDRYYADALINASQREAVLDILKKRLIDRTESIPESYLRAIALVSLYRAHPEWYASALLPIASSNLNRVGPVWHPEILKAEMLGYAGLLLTSLPDKIPEARAHCIESILELPTYGSTGPLPDSFSPVLQTEIPSVFDKLNGPEQQAVLGPLWNNLASPAIVPLLRNIIEQDRDQGARGRALLRLREFDPDLAQEEFAKEIAKPYPNLPLSTLQSFPGSEVPALNNIFLQHATAQIAENNSPGPHGYGDDIPALLLSRFASRSIEEQVNSLLDSSSGPLRCDERVSLVVYLHRVDPPAAEQRLESGSIIDAKCPVGQFARRIWSPTIQSLELTELDSADPGHVSDALTSLQHFASADARPFMLEHFKAWSDSFVAKHNLQGRVPPLSQDAVDSADSQLDGAYLRALIFAFGWRSSQSDIHGLGLLCQSAYCSNEAKQRELSYNLEDTFIVLGSGADEGLPYNYGLAPYGDVGELERMKQKLGQYPPGTAFRFDARGHSQRVIQNVEDTLGKWLSETGHPLSRVTY